MTALAPAHAVTWGPDFASRFLGESAGWAAVSGTWAPDAIQYRSTGVSGKMASARHWYYYGNFRFAARVKVTGFASYLWFRGSASPATSGFWKTGYAIGWTPAGQYAVFKTDAAGTTTTLITQTASTLFNDPSGYNTVKVSAADGIIGFTVNGVPLAAIADVGPKYGYVGVGFYNASGGEIFVDAASLVKFPDTADLSRPTSSTSSVLYAYGKPVRSPKYDIVHPWR